MQTDFQEYMFLWFTSLVSMFYNILCKKNREGPVDLVM